jgi:hypothetical protein
MGRSLLGSALLLGCVLLLVACGKPTAVGYWEGKGSASEVSLKDRYREMTRSADYDFWFVLDKDGNATGEIELKYDSNLTVQNLPSVSLGSVAFNPQVGGKITDLDPKRKFPLVGVLKDDELTLDIATPEEQRPPIEFTIRADPGVSADIGSVGVPGGGVGSGDVIKIPMKPFSPFNGAGKVEKRPSGPYAATFDKRGSNWAIEWSARQVGGEQRQVNITPEMRNALDRLRGQLGH